MSIESTDRINDSDLIIITYQQQAQLKDTKIYGLECTIEQLKREIAILQGDVSRLSSALRNVQEARNDESALRVTLERQVAVLAKPSHAPGDYRKARGCLPMPPDAPKPEEIIRKMRDAW